ncbi:MAG: chorismate mutase [Candidatus Eremiobacteraeota bacterium]|nr:chorismate mutase [Candidatus Eremiobacteraeota bacterium]
MRVRGVRGAITVESDSAAEIVAGTKRLLSEIIERNGIETEEIVSVLFSLTADLRAAFPALGAREMGWTFVPMLHFTEIAVPGSLARCIRVLMHVNTTRTQAEVEHVYLGGASALRPDLSGAPK